MSRTALTLIAAALLSLATAHVAAAQPPQESPTGCGDCDALARALADVERAASETKTKLADLEKKIQSQTAMYDAGQANRAGLQAKVKAGTGGADADATLRAYDVVMERIARELDALRRERQELNEQLARETERAARFRAALEACKKSCTPPPGGGGGGGTGTTGGIRVTPLPPDLEPIPECEPCRPSAEAIEKWEKEVADARAEVEKLELQNDAIDGMIRITDADEQRVRDRIAAGGAGKEWDEALGEIVRRKMRSGATKAGLLESLDAARARLKGLLERGPVLEDALDRCNESCPMPKPPRRDCTTGPCGSVWQDKRVLGVIGGAVAVGTLVIFSGGGETMPPVTADSPPVSPTPPVQQMPPVTETPPVTMPPPPPPRTTADGRYRCVGVTVVSDEGRHNPTINLGPQLTGDFDVREGSITIRHPAPFVDIVGAQFDTATGRFSGTAVGGVAGSPNVGVRAEGTVNTATGQIVFNYTMGTGGELPGGRSIIYGITLQKQ